MKKFSKILVYLLATTCLSSTLSFSKPEEEFFVEAETLSSTTTTTNPTSKIVYENVKVSNPENPASVAAALNSAKDGTTTGVSLLLADNLMKNLFHRIIPT